jgi:hypothetical protein
MACGAVLTSKMCKPCLRTKLSAMFPTAHSQLSLELCVLPPDRFCCYTSQVTVSTYN